MLFGAFARNLTPNHMIHCQTALARLNSISVFFSADSDEGSLAGKVTLGPCAAVTAYRRFEVLVVNDGSRAGTAAVPMDMDTTNQSACVLPQPVDWGHKLTQCHFYAAGDRQGRRE